MTVQHNVPRQIQQVGHRVRCKNCGQRGRYIKEYEGKLFVAAWYECLDCDRYQETYRYQSTPDPVFHLRKKS